MKRIALLAFLFVSICVGQKNKEFGKVSKELLESKEYSKDPSASAHIVFKKVDYNVGYYIDVHERIKIYDKEGFDWADFILTFPQIVKIEAHTYNLEDGKIKVSKASKKDIFEEELTKNLKIKKIPFPDVKEGSVIEIKYRSGYGGLVDFYIQDYIPLEDLNVKVTVPSRVRLKIEQNQRAFLNLSRIESGGDYLFKGKDIPAVEKEDYVDNIDNYRGKLTFNLLSMTFPQGGYVSYEGWRNVLWHLYDSDYNNQLKEKYSFYDKVIDSINEKSNASLERSRGIYTYVRDKMNWNDYYGFTSDKGIKKTFKSKEGNIADINLLLIKMLRKAGLKANPVLVSTRDQSTKLFPTLEDFNYLICGIEMPGEVILLDATSKLLKYGELKPEILGTKGRLVRDDQSHNSVNILPNRISSNNVILNATLNEDFIVSGRSMQRLTQYHAFNFRDVEEDFSDKDYLERLKEEHKNVDISGYEIKNLKDISKPIAEIFDFEFEEATESVAENIYLSPLLFLTEKESPFKKEKRNYPIDFNYPLQEKYMVTIKIPETMEVVSLPENADISIENGLAGFKYRISSSGKTIQLLYELQINQGIIPVNYYPQLKELFKLVVEKNTEKVVLKEL